MAQETWSAMERELLLGVPDPIPLAVFKLRLLEQTQTLISALPSQAGPRLARRVHPQIDCQKKTARTTTQIAFCFGAEASKPREPLGVRRGGASVNHLEAKEERN